MKEKLFLLDAGHGGLVAGEYDTPGKRATFDNQTIYEGVLNRAVAGLLQFKLALLNIKSEIINPFNIDIPLTYRVKRINAIVHESDYDVILISIHHNAADNEKANGCEIFTSEGFTQSDIYAKEYERIFKDIHPERSFRAVKENDFYILKNTLCPAILTEYSFMTNKKEFNYMANGVGIIDEVFMLVEWIMWINGK